MKQRKLCAAGLALLVLAAGFTLIGEATAHDSHGGRTMTEPGYERGDGSMTYGPCQSQEVYGWQHHGQHHRQHMGPGMMGQGHLAAPDGPMPEGMMGPTMGPGARTMPGGGFHMGEPLANDLTVGQVEHILGHRLERLGLTRLKVGEVVERDQGVIIAEIVTEDGSLVQRLEVDRHFGWSCPVE